MVATEKAPAAKSRATSGIAYPYFNLEQSIKVAAAIHENGGGSCTSDQLASFLNYSTVRSGTFLTRVSSARMFGLIVYRQNEVGITDRARAIIAPVMPEDCTKAKIDAFLDVPLYSAIYEKFHGHTLPPEAGLKNLLVQHYKIVPDRAGPATRVFYESADQAGLFTTGGRNRLIKPPFSTQTRRTESETEEDVPPPSPPLSERPRASMSQDGSIGIHPAIIGLLRELPPAGPWPKAQKERFLKAFQTTVDFIYPEPDSSDGSA